MWRRTYLLLILVRLYFAFSPSYLHPDENFQGPEVIAGKKVESPTRARSAPLLCTFSTGPIGLFTYRMRVSSPAYA